MVKVSLDIAKLLLSRTELDFGTNTSELSFNINNAGSGILEWSLQTDQNFISLSETNGTTTESETDQITVTVDRSNLQPGLSTGTITVVSNGGPPQTLDALVTVAEPMSPILELTPTTLDFDSLKTEKYFEIINTGAGTLVWRDSLDQNWIMVNPMSGSTLSEETDSVQVTVDRSGLEPAEYSGRIFVISNGGDKEVNVKMIVPVTPNQPPSIIHTPPPSPTAGQDMAIQGGITDDRGVASAEIGFRRGGEGNFTIIHMTNSGNTYQGMIPGAELTDLGIEYFIHTVDTDNASTQSATFSLEVIIPDPGVIKSTAQPAGSDQTAYRLISVPLNIDNKSPKDIMEDDLGPFDKKQWRFFELVADQSYAEFPNTSLMTSGKSFWLIVNEADIRIDTGPGKTNLINEEFEISLHPKWNFVGNPFNFRIPIANTRMQLSGLFMSGSELSSKQFIRQYTGTWSPQPVQELLPFEGYALYNPETTNVTFLINPGLSATNLAKQSLDERPLWSIRVLAQVQDARDTDNVAAVYSNASNNLDNYDRPEPPVIGEYVSVYFPYPQRGLRREKLSLDARPELLDGEIWEFEVKTNIRDKVTLTFDGLYSVPASFDVRLVDEKLKLTENLREDNVFTVVGIAPEQPKRLKLVVGRPDFVDELQNQLHVIPSTFELSQNFPNPFNPSTAIRYGLPNTERVTLKVYNLLGEEVVTLVDDELMPAGFHVANWDGHNQSGQPVSSGIYVYQLRTERVLTKKMLLIK